MAVTTPAAFDPTPRRLGSTGNFLVTAAVLEGQVVAFHGTGVDWSVGPASTTGAYTGAPLGVALYTQAVVGGRVAVAMFGSVVKVCNATAVTILAGAQVMPGLTASAGCVTPLLTSNATGADGWLIGTMITKATANDYGYCLITGPNKIWKGAA